jgi:hypothetical protein
MGVFTFFGCLGGALFVCAVLFASYMLVGFVVVAWTYRQRKDPPDAGVSLRIHPDEAYRRYQE